MEDSSSPYFLSNGDYLGLFLVSHHLSNNNYNTWNCVMLTALTTKNKVGFIDGSIPHLDAHDLLYKSWVHYNSMVISWILNFVINEIVDSLLCKDTAIEI